MLRIVSSRDVADAQSEEALDRERLEFLRDEGLDLLADYRRIKDQRRRREIKMLIKRYADER